MIVSSQFIKKESKQKISLLGSYQLFGVLHHEYTLLHCFDFQASLPQDLVALEALFDILSIKEKQESH